MYFWLLINTNSSHKVHFKFNCIIEMSPRAEIVIKAKMWQLKKTCNDCTLLDAIFKTCMHHILKNSNIC